MNLCVIGLGLMGGSFALSLKKQMTDLHVIGVDKSEAHSYEAKALGIIDEVAELDDALMQSDVVIITIPVDDIANLLPDILDKISKETVVIDFGSTKTNICKAVENHPNRDQFVAVHPIAGTEHSGPNAAFVGLYHHATTIICERDKSSQYALDTTNKLFEALQMRVIYMSAGDHDRHIAYVSHLSHITSFALSAAVLDIEKDEKSIFDMAGSGFSSTVRLAKSSPDMWAPIFSQNNENVLEALKCYIKKLEELKTHIENHDQKATSDFMTDANDIRRVLQGLEKPPYK